MARINVEIEDLHKDGRFIDLCIALGSRRMALGALVEAWILAQDYVGPENPKALFPEIEWERHRLAHEIIECRLAIVEDGMVYMIGAEEQFKWLLQRRAAAKKGGEANAARFQQGEATGSRPEADREATESPLTLSSNSFPLEQKKHTETPRKPRDPLGDHMRSKVSEREVRSRLFEPYPSKIGWDPAWRNYLRGRMVTNPEELEQMTLAVGHYRQHLKRVKSPAGMIKTFSNFWADDYWRGFIDPPVVEDFSEQDVETAQGRDWKEIARKVKRIVESYNPTQSDAAEILERGIDDPRLLKAVYAVKTRRFRDARDSHFDLKDLGQALADAWDRIERAETGQGEAQEDFPNSD